MHSKNPGGTVLEFINMCDRDHDTDTKSEPSTFGNDVDRQASAVGPFMGYLFEKQLYTDVTFFSGGCKATVSAHRAVLAAKNGFFEELLFGAKKNEGVGMEMQVQIMNIPFSVFTNIIKYFYTGDIEFPDNVTVLEIYAAAQSFRIQQLLDRCEVYLQCIELSDEGVCSVLQACNGKQVEGLKGRCIRYIEENASRVLRSADFERCSFLTVREICALSRLRLASETELLESIVRWLDGQPKHARPQLRVSLLRCVRFLSLTPREFGEVVRRHPDLLTPEDALKILMHLNCPNGDSLKTLPEWCCKQPRTFQADCGEGNKIEIPLPRPSEGESSKEGRIQVELKPTSDEYRDVCELTSIVRLQCLKGVHEVKSLEFSFLDLLNAGQRLADIVVRVQVSPNGPTFRKNYWMRSAGSSTLIFTRGVRIFKGQTVQIEATAKIDESCRFLRFHKWHNDPRWDFWVYLISKPEKGSLNFISEIQYESLSPEP